MIYHFFAVSALAAGPGRDELNAFCQGHKIITLDKHFVAAGAESYWAFCVTTLDQDPAPNQEKRGKVDYREILDSADFSLFAKLRSLRKTLADEEGVPAYALFTNEQLVEMVRGPIKSMAQMAALNGVGKAKVEKYGRAFLNLLCPAPENMPSPEGDHEAARP